MHIEADLLYQMIVAGRVMPEEPGVMPPEAERQLRLRLRNACLLARSFYEAGFSVVIDEIIIGERYDHLIGGPGRPAVRARRARTAGRSRLERSAMRLAASGLCSARSGRTYLDGELRATMAGRGVWIDNSDQTPEETVEDILSRPGD